MRPEVDESTSPPELLEYLLEAHGLGLPQEESTAAFLDALKEHAHAGCQCKQADVHQALLDAADSEPPAPGYRPEQLEVDVFKGGTSPLKIRVTWTALQAHVEALGRVWAMPDLLTACATAAALGQPLDRLETRRGDSGDAAGFLLVWRSPETDVDVDGVDWNVGAHRAFPTYPDSHDGIAGYSYEFREGSGSPAASDYGFGVLRCTAGRYWVFASDPGEWAVLEATNRDEALAEFATDWNIFEYDEDIESTTWGF